MNPNIFIDEQVLRGRVQEQHATNERLFRLVLARQPRRRVLPWLAGRLGARLVALGTRMQQLEQKPGG